MQDNDPSATDMLVLDHYRRYLEDPNGYTKGVKNGDMKINRVTPKMKAKLFCDPVLRKKFDDHVSVLTNDLTNSDELFELLMNDRWKKIQGRTPRKAYLWCYVFLAFAEGDSSSNAEKPMTKRDVVKLAQHYSTNGHKDGYSLSEKTISSWLKPLLYYKKVNLTTKTGSS